jgi:hypothetical protein
VLNTLKIKFTQKNHFFLSKIKFQSRRLNFLEDINNNKKRRRRKQQLAASINYSITSTQHTSLYTSSLLQLVHLNFTQDSAKNSTPSVAATIGLNVNITTHQRFVALQMNVRRENGVVVARHVIAQIVFV